MSTLVMEMGGLGKQAPEYCQKADFCVCEPDRVFAAMETCSQRMK
jgi:hypothetical protein